MARFLLLSVVLLCVVTIALSAQSQRGVIGDAMANRLKFKAFKQQYGKQYESIEAEELRFKIFRQNLNYAAELDNNDQQATFGVTQFMDLTQEEFKQMYLNPQPLFQSVVNHDKPVEPVQLSGPAPATFDWRQQTPTCVTPVYNQEQCGSCWAFSATETIESAWCLAGNALTEFSMQQIVSCDHKGSYGCNGGEPYSAYEYVISAGGIETYADYPYKSGDGVTGTCQFNSKDIVGKISNWAWVSRSDVATPKGNETAMLQGSYTYGPLSICVDATTWQYYTGGIITANCGTALDHCVQLIGWNTANNINYWTVRNSWGVTWGNAGYIYVERNKDLCGIANEVTRVII